MKKAIEFKKLPPHSDSAERAVLGAILLDNSAFDKVISDISPDMFYQSTHQHIFKAMFSLYLTKQVIDLVTLADKLQSNGDLEIVGGVIYLMDLMEATPTATTITHHAEIVKKKAILRKIIAITTKLNLESYEERTDPEELLIEAEELIHGIHEQEKGNRKNFIPLSESIPATFQNIERINEDTETQNENIIPTGFNDLDEIIGGLTLSEMTILAARPSIGKTSFACNIAVNVAKTDIPVAIFSVESTIDSISERILCSEAMVSSYVIHKKWMKESDWPKIVMAGGVLGELPIYIDDSPRLSLQDFRFKTKMAVKKYGIKLVIVDYIQKMHIKGSRDKYSEITEISSGISAVLKEFWLAGLILSQLSREVEKSKPPIPKVSHLRESGYIEQDADKIILMHKPVSDDQDFTICVNVAKNRNGPTGNVEMVFEKKYTRFQQVGCDHFE